MFIVCYKTISPNIQVKHFSQRCISVISVIQGPSRQEWVSPVAWLLYYAVEYSHPFRLENICGGVGHMCCDV